MLAATAGDAHGVRVLLSSLFLSFFLVGFTSWSPGSFFTDHIRHVIGTNHRTRVTRELFTFSDSSKGCVPENQICCMSVCLLICRVFCVVGKHDRYENIDMTTFEQI